MKFYFCPPDYVYMLKTLWYQQIHNAGLQWVKLTWQKERITCRKGLIICSPKVYFTHYAAINQFLLPRICCSLPFPFEKYTCKLHAISHFFLVNSLKYFGVYPVNFMVLTLPKTKSFADYSTPSPF